MADGTASPRTARALATRARVLDTAKACITELGLLGATSNEIARRAGVSWGVIQHHFGSREGILLALIEEGFDSLLDVLDQYDESAPESSDHRIQLVADAIWNYCSQPEYMLYMDVLRVLSNDPNTIDAVDAMMRRTEQQLTRRMNRLLRDVIRSDSSLAATRSLIFATMRGLALKLAFARTSRDPDKATAAERRLLVDALQRVLGNDESNSG